jgi:hypothetical protein
VPRAVGRFQSDDPAAEIGDGYLDAVVVQQRVEVDFFARGQRAPSLPGNGRHRDIIKDGWLLGRACGFLLVLINQVGDGCAAGLC